MTGFLFLRRLYNTNNMTPYIYSGLTDQGRNDFRYKIRYNDPGKIISGVCVALNIERSKLLSKTRTKDLSEARCIAMSLILKANPSMSLKRVGKIFDRDHSTVIYQRDLFEDLNGKNKLFTSKVELVRGRV